MLTQGIYDQILTRALKDPTFRTEILSSPRVVLKRDYNISVPDSVGIRVLEDGRDTMTITLPAALERTRQLIQDKELGNGSSVEQVIVTWTFICSSEGPCKQ